MALPELVTPVVAYVGAPALAYAAARSMWHVARALVITMASFVAIKTDDDKRRNACLALVDKLTRQGSRPRWPRRRGIGRLPPSPPTG